MRVTALPAGAGSRQFRDVNPHSADDRVLAQGGPAELTALLRQLQAARATVETLRSHTRSLASNPAQVRLLESLERYVAALQARHLPVPPAIRDELNLQRCLVPRPAIVRAATRRRAGRR